MENNNQENKKSSVNIIAVLLAFVMGLCAGNISSDKIYPDKNADTTSASLISRAPTDAKTAEKSSHILSSSAEVLSYTPSSAAEEPSSSLSSAEEQTKAYTDSYTDSFTVYITPTGKRYHLSPDCAGKNKIESDLDEAASKGLTPCKKCADG